MNILKKMAGWFLPSNAKLALETAKSIQSGVNGVVDDKKAVIAKYSRIGAEMSEVATTLGHILEDGNIDDMETETVAKLLEPLYAKAREILGV